MTTASLVVISLLSISSALPAAAFLAIVAGFGLTYMFSDAGVRALLPALTPGELWERANAADSTGYLVAWIVGPPVAATIVAVAGGEVAFLAIAAVFCAAAALLRGVAEKKREGGADGGLLSEALAGLKYAWTNATIRGLGISVAVTNVSWGIGLIIVPVIVVDTLSAPQPIVGIAFTTSGVVGVASALLFGRLDTRGREWRLLLAAMIGIGLAALFLLPGARASTAGVGVAWVLVSMAVLGFSSGLWDIALFTLRQRRTEPVLMGRAFAISMAMNQTGVPIGAALAGWMAPISVESAIVISAGAGLFGALLAALLVPMRDPLDATSRVL